MSSESQTTIECTAAKVLAPDDLCVGDYVSVIRRTNEYLSFCWSGDAHLLPAESPVRVTWIPSKVAAPRKVLAVCLPFVFLVDNNKKYEQVDVRMTQLARVDKAFALLVAKKTKKTPKKNRKIKKKRK